MLYYVTYSEYIPWKNSSDCNQGRCRNQRRNGDHGSKPAETQCHVDHMNHNFPTDRGAAATPQFPNTPMRYISPYCHQLSTYTPKTCIPA